MPANVASAISTGNPSSYDSTYYSLKKVKSPFFSHLFIYFLFINLYIYLFIFEKTGEKYQLENRTSDCPGCVL